MESNNGCPCKGCTEETERTIGCHETCSRAYGLCRKNIEYLKSIGR